LKMLLPFGSVIKLLNLRSEFMEFIKTFTHLFSLRHPTQHVAYYLRVLPREIKDEAFE
jgi:hypothetical protein